jgi:hypothetical protein
MASILKIKNSPGTRFAYSRGFFLDELLVAADSDRDRDFVKFQLDCLSRFRRGFEVDACSVVLCGLDSNNLIANTNAAIGWNLPEGEVDAYRRCQRLEEPRAAVLRNAGTAVFHSDFRSLEEWRETPIFPQYYQPLNVLHSASVAFLVPFQSDQRVQFTYFKTLDRQFDPSLSKEEVVFLSAPFYFAWAYRWGLIDLATFREWLLLLVGCKPLQLFLLRALIAMPRYSLGRVSEMFGMQSRNVNHHFAEVYETVLPLLAGEGGFAGNASKMVDLAQAFHFLRYLGAYRFGPTR